MTKTFQFMYKLVIPAFIAFIMIINAQSGFVEDMNARTPWLIVAWIFGGWAIFNAIKYAVNWKGLGIFKKNP